MNLKKITAIALGAVMTVSMAVPTFAADDVETVTDGKLTVATSPDFAPYEFYSIDDDGNPTLAGFDMDLAKYIADKMGLELEVVPMDFDGVLSELSQKNVDLGMAGLSPDPARADAMEFSDLYYKGGQSFVTVKDKADQFKTLEDANNKDYSIGAQTGSIQLDLANENTPDADIVSLPKVTDLITELLTGKMDGAFIETAVAAFQHRIYLQNEIDNYGYAIQNIGNTFIIPLNLYSQKVSSIDELKDGDVVAIPDDLTNGGRALKVLEAAGLIELDPNAAFNPTVDDITSYKVNITIEELKANTIPSVLPDVAAAVVNGNYALDFGLKTDEAIYKDSVLDVEEYWNLIAARTADIEDPDTAAIYEKVVEAFQSSATEDVFNNTFGGYFIAVGWDQDLINQ